MQLGGADDNPIELLELVPFHLHAIDKRPVVRAQIHDKNFSVLLDDLGVLGGNRGVVDDHVISGVAADADAFLVEINLLDFQLRLEPGAEDERPPGIPPESDVIAVSEVSRRHAPAVDKGTVRRAVEQGDSAALETKFGVHAGDRRVVNRQRAAGGVPPHFQAAVGNVQCPDGILVHDELQVGSRHQVRQLDLDGPGLPGLALVLGGSKVFRADQRSRRRAPNPRGRHAISRA